MDIHVDHCKRCGNVFQVFHSKFCADCQTFIRTEVERCSAYLKSHSDCTLDELSEAVEVSRNKLIYYINEGKLYVYDYPNLHYHCHFCETEIQRGYLCTPCAARFKLEVNDLYMKEGYKVDKVSQQIQPQSPSRRRIGDAYTVQGRRREQGHRP